MGSIFLLTNIFSRHSRTELLLSRYTSSGSTSATAKFKFRVTRAFKALDDGLRRKWVIVAAAKDLPSTLPLDANARIPNVIKNKTCSEQRETLLTNPELFQIFNGGIVCTASTVEVKQDGSEMYVEIAFDTDAEQGIVNGGHSYATLLHVLHDVTTYSDGKDLRATLISDAKNGLKAAAELIALSDDLLQERIAKAREKAQVQIELVAPVGDSELLAQIARARNLSLGVEATALANLAGRFDHMKSVLAAAGESLGSDFNDRVVWKTNQEVSEDSKAIPVKLLIDLIALMDFQAFPPDTRVANAVFTRSVLVIREFSEAEGERAASIESLTKLLPQFIVLYDRVYEALAEVDPGFPWSDGKLDVEKKRRRSTVTTPLLGHACVSKVANAFIWPIYSSMRALLSIDENTREVFFKEDPVAFFEEKIQELAATVQNFHRNQAHGILQQVGKDKEVWLRLDSIVQMELKLRERLALIK